MTDLALLRRSHDARVRRMLAREGERDALRRQETALENEVSILSSDIVTLGRVLAVFHTLTESVQERFLHSVETLVTSGLHAVFGPDVSFKIEPVLRGKAVHLDVFCQDAEGHRFDVLDGRGGGLASLAGVILRIVMVRLLGDRTRQVVFLDEAIGMLSADFQDAAGQLLRKLADDLGVQIIAVTHQPELAEHADVRYRVRSTSEGAVAERVT